MKKIHIKAPEYIDDNIISSLMNVLLKNKFKVEKYLGVKSKIVMTKKENR